MPSNKGKMRDKRRKYIGKLCKAGCGFKARKMGYCTSCYNRIYRQKKREKEKFEKSVNGLC